MKFTVAPALALLALAGCAQKNTDNLEAVKQGVLHDLPKDINVGSMDVNVVSANFRGQEADAIVSFSPKGGPPAMTMNYTMERKGDEWHIKARAQSDIQKHAAQAPEGAMQDQGGMQGSTPLPPGHPTTGGAAPGPVDSSKPLPPGHPPLGDDTKKP